MGAHKCIAIEAATPSNLVIDSIIHIHCLAFEELKFRLVRLPPVQKPKFITRKFPAENASEC